MNESYSDKIQRKRQEASLAEQRKLDRNEDASVIKDTSSSIVQEIRTQAAETRESVQKVEVTNSPKKLEAVVTNFNLDKLSNAIEGLSHLQGIQGNKGDDGKTPIKGKDYFTDKEIKAFAKDIISRIKVPTDGKTPIKGVDYFTDDEIQRLVGSILQQIPVPKNGKNGKDGKDGEGFDLDYAQLIKDVVKQIPKPKDGKDGVNTFVTNGKNPYATVGYNGQIKLSATDPTAGYLEDKLVAGSNITLTSINDTLQISSSGGGGGGSIEANGYTSSGDPINLPNITAIDFDNTLQMSSNGGNPYIAIGNNPSVDSIHATTVYTKVINGDGDAINLYGAVIINGVEGGENPSQFSGGLFLSGYLVLQDGVLGGILVQDGDATIASTTPYLRLKDTNDESPDNSGGIIWHDSTDVEMASIQIADAGDLAYDNQAGGHIFNQPIIANDVIYPLQATSAPAYVKGAIYFDTTLNKLRVGGLTDWETVTSI